MAIRKLKPTTPVQRFRTVADFAEITRSEPEKSLLEPLAFAAICSRCCIALRCSALRTFWWSCWTSERSLLRCSASVWISGLTFLTFASAFSNRCFAFACLATASAVR